MAAERERLADRVRRSLAHESTIREVPMFGGLSFMVNEKMVVAAYGDGSLLVRLDPARHRELIDRPGAQQAEMGAGRSMGSGWIRVDHNAITADAQLSFWLDVAMDYNATAGGGR